MVIGLLTLELHFPGARSLKDKRQVLRRLKDRVRALNVSVAEVAHQDLWQRARLGIAAQVRRRRAHLAAGLRGERRPRGFQPLRVARRNHDADAFLQ